MTAKGRQAKSKSESPSSAKQSPRPKKQVAAASKNGKRSANAAQPTRTRSPASSKKPRGRDETMESILNATLSLWSTEGPTALTLRDIAAEAGVNYGLVYRHFGTKNAVIRAAMELRLERSLDAVDGCTDLNSAVKALVPLSKGSGARLLAWSILQYMVEDVLPPENPYLQRLFELATDGKEELSDAQRVDAAVLVGSLIALLNGWRLFEPYLVTGLGLESLSHAELDTRIMEAMNQLLVAQGKRK
jgi:TetR/AcrR family transcriptional regulator, repressor for neighboring sulfatase